MPVVYHPLAQFLGLGARYQHAGAYREPSAAEGLKAQHILYGFTLKQTVQKRGEFFFIGNRELCIFATANICHSQSEGFF